MSKILTEGGPHGVRRTGADTYKMTVRIPNGENGRVASECPEEECSPGYFKVLPGTGITENHDLAYCPYCHFSAPPDQFVTKEQVRYAEELFSRSVMDGIEKEFKSAFGVGPSGKKRMGGGAVSMEISVSSTPKPPVRRPFEEDVRRDVVCPNCGLDHSVYGLAVWCADCGEDIFLTHVAAEITVVRAMLSDVARRRSLFGVRVAAKDIENCLEDSVSIMEAVLKALTRRALNQRKLDKDEIDRYFKKLGNAFQNLRRTHEILLKDFQIDILEAVSHEEFSSLALMIEKRHPITHNLGVIDKNYLQRVRTFEDEGKEVLVAEAEIDSALDSVMKLSGFVHGKLFATT